MGQQKSLASFESHTGKTTSKIAHNILLKKPYPVVPEVAQSRTLGLRGRASGRAAAAGGLATGAAASGSPILEQAAAARAWARTALLGAADLLQSMRAMTTTMAHLA